jgi:hypothetical protein
LIKKTGFDVRKSIFPFTDTSILPVNFRTRTITRSADTGTIRAAGCKFAEAADLIDLGSTLPAVEVGALSDSFGIPSIVEVVVDGTDSS